jgi:hypothetical protein
MFMGLHVKYPLFLSDFNQTSIFMADFQKIHPVEAEFHVDGQTDMPKLFEILQTRVKIWKFSFIYAEIKCTSAECC